MCPIYEEKVNTVFEFYIAFKDELIKYMIYYCTVTCPNFFIFGKYIKYFICTIYSHVKIIMFILTGNNKQQLEINKQIGIDQNEN